MRRSGRTGLSGVAVRPVVVAWLLGSEAVSVGASCWVGGMVVAAPMIRYR